MPSHPVCDDLVSRSSSVHRALPLMSWYCSVQTSCESESFWPSIT